MNVSNRLLLHIPLGNQIRASRVVDRNEYDRKNESMRESSAVGCGIGGADVEGAVIQRGKEVGKLYLGVQNLTQLVVNKRQNRADQACHSQQDIDDRRHLSHRQLREESRQQTHGGQQEEFTQQKHKVNMPEIAATQTDLAIWK